MKTSKEANDCARTITRHVEEITGKELPLESCMKIVACVQLAINEASKVAVRGALDQALNSGSGAYCP